ncbi:MAG: hypothetical protein II829_07295 [Bacteroidales bacterium]|nr:hypothetical protein [Bacteroidales bacterium]
MLIEVSLTAFMNYLNSSGTKKISAIQKAKEDSLNSFEPHKDYWFKFRQKVSSLHKTGFSEDGLRAVVDEVPEDRQKNYSIAVDGYCKFWSKRKTAKWIKPLKGNWSKGELRVSINPEVCLEHRGKVYLIKLFLHINEPFGRKQADMITWLMRDSFGKKASDNMVFCVLDVKKGTLYQERTIDPKIKALVESEAISFVSLWNNL